MKCEKHNQFYEDIGGTCPGCVGDLKRAEIVRKTFGGKTLNYAGTVEGRSQSTGPSIENLQKAGFAEIEKRIASNMAVMPFPNLFSDDLTLKFYSRDSQQKRREFDPLYYALGISTKGSVIDDIVNAMIPLKVNPKFEKFWTEGTHTIVTDTKKTIDEILDDITEVECRLGFRQYKTCLVCMRTDVARRCDCIGEQP